MGHYFLDTQYKFMDRIHNSGLKITYNPVKYISANGPSFQGIQPNGQPDRQSKFYKQLYRHTNL